LCYKEYKKAVLKRLRVGSAHNAPPELKQEIAAVRLLQFGLTAANLRQAVARAVDVAEHAALHAMKEGEPAEEDCDAENGNTDFCGTAVQRESHAPILARIPNLARCKAKITDEGGVKSLCWVADSGTLSGAPVINGTSGNRFVARWSGTAAD
jgi:hypothetical protein